jgi:hypothetical protein
MKKFITLVIIVMLVLLPSCKFIQTHNPFNKKANAKELAIQRQIDSIRVTDSLRNEALVVKRKAMEDSLALATREVKTSTIEESLKYHIIIGSFITPEYATSYAEFYSRRGLPTEIIDKTNSRFKLVSASSFGTLNEASRAIKAIRDTVEAESWVYKTD